MHYRGRSEALRTNLCNPRLFTLVYSSYTAHTFTLGEKMTSRSGILPYSPLKYVIASIRFAPYIRMPAKIAEIQDEMREVAPLVNTIQMVEQPGGAAGAAGAPTSSSTWMLMAPDKSYCFHIAQDQLLVINNKYARFDLFIKQYEFALNVLLNHMRFLDVQALGVRYIDHVKIRSNESFSDYLTSNWLPPTMEGYLQKGGNVFAEYEKDEANALRVMIQTMPNTLPIPNDLLGLLMMTQTFNGEIKLDATTDRDLIIDIDSIKRTDEPKRMQAREVLENLGKLHSTANSFFRNSEFLKDHAFKVWKGEI